MPTSEKRVQRAYNSLVHCEYSIAAAVPYVAAIAIFCCGFIAGRIVGKKESIHEREPIFGAVHGRFGVFRPFK
jgi:hypothetical protein